MTKGMTKIVDTIISEAKVKGIEILNLAKGNASQIVNDAKKEADNEVQTIITDYDLKSKRVIDTLGATSRMHTRKQLLMIENQLIQESFEHAIKDLIKFKKTKKYVSYLEHEIVKSLKSYNKINIELLVPKDERKHYTKTMLTKLNRSTGCKLTLSKSNVDLIGGLILVLTNDNIEINLSFESKLDTCRKEKLSKIAKLLNPERK